MSTLLFGAPTTASATVFTYCVAGTGAACNFVGNNPATAAPGDVDIDDLDHTKFYSWRIDNINLTGGALKSASLTFKQMYNWDANANQLFLSLFDTAINAGLSSSTDGPDSTTLSDAYNTATLRDDLVANGTAGTQLTSRSFAAIGNAPNTAPGPGSTSFPSNGWSVIADGTDVNNKNLYTYTYTFTEAQEDKVEQYVANGNNIALFLDPDCHFFNDGIALTLTTGYPSVAEPISLTLFATALAGAAYRRRRQRTAGR